MPVSVHLAPTFVPPEVFAGSVAIVVDLIRATTTITSALAAGADRVIPCATIEEVHGLRGRFEAGTILTGGERGGLAIEGFDLGNGPQEYTTERVKGRTILFTTTNGTRAIRHAGLARHVLAGCFLNLDSVVGLACRLSREGGSAVPIHILCAGVEGKACVEDTLCAGALAERVTRALGERVGGDDGLAACGAWRAHGGTAASLVGALRASEGGRNLERIGLGWQVDACAAMNTTAIVPRRVDGGALIGERFDAV